MNRQKGKKREKDACCHDGNHVSEIPTRCHFDIFHDISERPSSFDNTLFQHHQILFQKNHIGRFFGDIYTAVDRNTDISLPDRRCVIDSISHISYGMSHTLKRLHNSLFLIRGKFGKQVAACSFFFQCFIIHSFHIPAGQHLFTGQPYLPADFYGNAFTVSCQNHRSHPMRFQSTDGCLCTLLWRVQESHKTQ